MHFNVVFNLCFRIYQEIYSSHTENHKIHGIRGRTSMNRFIHVSKQIKRTSKSTFVEFFQLKQTSQHI